MKRIIESSLAMAEVIADCRPQVISAYPITPQTHIVEALAKLKAQGKLGAEYLRAESEFAAASIVLGASATGVRTYSATTSQGLLLMAEVLFDIAGMRLPVVMTCANRAISAPINIWNDHQDVMTIRDAGWIMLFAENLQEALDMHVVAFRLAESLALPVMVNVDGFALTHVTEIADSPEKEKIDKYLSEYKPKDFLDAKDPKTFGYLSDPSMYQEMRIGLHEDVMAAKDKILELSKDFHNIFGRLPFGLIETYKLDDAEIVYIAMGSVFGTLRDAIDELRQEGIRAGALKICCFRPFPGEEILKIMRGILAHTPDLPPRIIVIDRSISLGSGGILANEIKAAFYEKMNIRIDDYIMGLGGRDITKEDLKDLIEK